MMRGESLRIEPRREERDPLRDAGRIALANAEAVAGARQDMEFSGGSGFLERKEEPGQSKRYRRIVGLPAQEKGRGRVWRRRKVGWDRGIDERHEIRPGTLGVDGVGRATNAGVE